MSRSTIKGYWRQRGTPVGTPAVSTLQINASFDPTSTSQISLGFYPKGSIPLEVTSFGGATGGSTPTVIIGTVANDDGFGAAVDADGVVFGAVGALTGIELTVDTEFFGKVGASAATGGTWSGLVSYVMSDDGGE